MFPGITVPKTHDRMPQSDRKLEEEKVAAGIISAAGIITL